MMKYYDYKTEEFKNMEVAHNRIIDWIFKVHDEILTANDKLVLIKIVSDE